MTIWFCPRCARPGEQAEAYTYCIRCRNERQAAARKRAFCCPQCSTEGEKHPRYRLCVKCAAERIERAGETGLKSREESNWMRGFDSLSQEYLKRKLV